MFYSSLTCFHTYRFLICFHTFISKLIAYFSTFNPYSLFKSFYHLCSLFSFCAHIMSSMFVAFNMRSLHNCKNVQKVKNVKRCNLLYSSISVLHILIFWRDHLWVEYHENFSPKVFSNLYYMKYCIFASC